MRHGESLGNVSEEVGPQHTTLTYNHDCMLFFIFLSWIAVHQAERGVVWSDGAVDPKAGLFKSQSSLSCVMCAWSICPQVYSTTPDWKVRQGTQPAIKHITS